jgi:hypothetical protein
VNGSAERKGKPTDMRGGQPPIEILTGADVAGKFYIGNMFERVVALLLCRHGLVG